jgi:hypothetical protein
MKNKNEERLAAPVHPPSPCSIFTPRGLVFWSSLRPSYEDDVDELPDFVSCQLPARMQASDSASLAISSQDLRSHRVVPLEFKRLECRRQASFGWR